MKLGIFTDSHYSSVEVNGKRYNRQSLRKIRQAYEYFQTQNCDLVICLGDLIDTEPDHAQEIENLKEVAAIIQSSPLRTFVVMGNHDAFRFEQEEYYNIVGPDCKPQNLCIGQNHLCFLDACYFKNGVHYGPGDEDWTDTFYPHAENLRRYLSTQKEDTYLFIHQSIDPAIRQDHRLFNGDELFDIIEKSGTVRAVYQGHYHPGKESVYNGIPYITFPAMCENEDAYYIVETP